MPNRPSELILTNPKAIKMLEEEKTFLLLQPFSMKPCSIKEASVILNLSISNCSYWVKQFLKVDLLVIAYEKKRSGSSIKYYWMAAERLVINLENKPEMLKNYYLRLFNIQSINISKSIASLVDELGLKLVIDITPSKDSTLNSKLLSNKKTMQNSLRQEFLQLESPAVVAACRGLSLEFEDAKSLQNELWSLLDKYEQKAINGQSKYYFTIALAPEKT